MLRSQFVRTLTKSVTRAALIVPRRHAIPAFTTGHVVYKRFNSSSTTVTTDGAVIPNSVIQLSTADYHQYANETLESMLEDLEELMDSKDCGDLDAELSNGILTLSIPNNGNYVINKQPPNKQIWFSSPISGPNRFDYIDGEWVSLRDNVKLLDITGKELADGLGFEFKFSSA